MDERFQKADERKTREKKREREREKAAMAYVRKRERARERGNIRVWEGCSIIIFLRQRLIRAKSGPNRSLYTPDWGGYQSGYQKIKGKALPKQFQCILKPCYTTRFVLDQKKTKAVQFQNGIAHIVSNFVWKLHHSS